MVKNNADLVIINTCAVTMNAIRKGKRMIIKARKENPKAKILVMGCWPKVYKEADDTEAMGDLIIIRSENELEEVIGKFKLRETVSDGDDANSEMAACAVEIGADDRSRYSIKIQDGCEQFCSYCVIPYARGKLKSRSSSEVIKEITRAVQMGYREAVLCGIHLGLYGKDSGANLADLLKKIVKIKGLERIRLSSIEITEVTGELIKLMADRAKIKEGAKICRHLHIPLQSGSDKILQLMNRPYGVKYFKEKVKQIRKKMPEVALTTDVIVGFPGETDIDFKETYDFIREIKFSRLHIFPFSAHERTPASKMPGVVTETVKKERVAELKKLGEKLAKEYKRKFRGKKLDFIIEHGPGSGFIGKSEYYFDLVLTAKELKRAAKLAEDRLIGKLVKIMVK